MRGVVMRTGLLMLVTCLALHSLRAESIMSPGRALLLQVRLSGDGEPAYALTMRDGRVVVGWSRLGLELKDPPSLLAGFSMARVDSSLFDETWKPVWGEESTIRNRYKELCVTFTQKAERGRTMLVRFRLYDDGLGFRYEFPEQEHLKYFIVMGERTEFALTGDHTAFWIPGDYDTNEYPYTTSRLSAVDATKGNIYQEIGTKTVIAPNAVQTPLMMKAADGLYINIHEAALVNYPAMDLLIDRSAFRLSATLVPDAFGNKAYMQTSCRTPWRTVIVGTSGAAILRSRIILNLNEPCALASTEWIKPRKFVGIWWGMHIGTKSWNYSDVNNVKLVGTDWNHLKPNGRHGATTEETKRYVDFAAKNGIDAVLIEGWNVGWEDWWGNWKEEVFDFVTPYPDFDVNALQAYARAKGVALIMHHETSASVTNYERRMDEAYRFMKDHGYDAVKTGYVGRIIPRGEFHDGQWMVNHYVRVAEKTASYRIMVDAHEPVRPTGLQRTYPNWMACEAARGNEYNAWSRGNPPEHETILPFTRLMGGPMDYTPGIFQIKLNYYDSTKKEVVHTTLVKQLALYVTMYSPLQMAADLPENYERFPDAFQFIRDVAVDWDATEIIEAEPGDILVIARKAKGKDEWYIGGITDENARTSTFSLNFLPEGHRYEATLYADAPGADWEKNPMAYTISKTKVKKGSRMTIAMAPGGGAAISIRPMP
jgi:glucan 1,4-alpha-glucosidase